jgi:hypothetical protein
MRKPSDNSMQGPLDAQQCVIDPFESIGMQRHRFRHHALDLIDHHPELPAVPPFRAELRAIVEQVKVKTERMITNAGDVFFDAALGARFFICV